MCRRRTGKGVRNKQRGAALVEFAIVAVLLFTLLLGIIDYGLLFKDYLALSQVAREGARTAALGKNYNATVEEWATKLNLGTVDVTPVVSGTEPDVHVGVTLNYTHDMLTGFFGPSKDLEATMVMRKESD